MIEQLKIIVVTLGVVGIVISFYKLKYSPDKLILESPPKQPAWLPRVGWCITSAAAFLYIGLDFLGS